MVVGGRASGVITLLATPDALEAGGAVPLDATEVHHLRVRRVADGDIVRLVSGTGLVAFGPLARSGAEARVEVSRLERAPRPPALTLAVGAGEKDRFAWLVEKAAELGVTEVFPLETTHSVAVASKLRHGHLESLRRRALEAIKQCGAPWAPVVHEPLPFTEFARQEPDGHRWLADPAGVPPGSLEPATPVTVVVGPEGGLTEPERAALLESGYQPVGLGPNTLRFETAAIAAAVVVNVARRGGGNG